MRTRRDSRAAVTVLVGFAANERGRGIAYARLAGMAATRLLRLEFCVGSIHEKAEPAVAYAALTAVARAVVRSGISRAKFVVADENFVNEIATGTGVGETLAIPYVRLRCVFNSLAHFSIAAGATDDLTQRARAEAALNIAA